MSYSLPLHLALLLVPYLAPADIACAQCVCKPWRHIFTSTSLLLATLRTHFPLSHEVLTHGTSPSTFPSPQQTFTRIARRYHSLSQGRPQQELRLPTFKTRRDIYVWTFSSNLLVYLSKQYPVAVLSLVYFDYAATPRRVRRGELALDTRAETLIRVKVCRDILLVERTTEVATGSRGRTNFRASATFYRLQVEDGDGGGVKAEMVNSVDTFEFAYIDYSHQILSDHSGVYYAAYSKSALSDWGVGVWEIATGRKVRRIAPALLEGLGGLMCDLLLVREGGAQKIVMVGNDRRNNNARRWDRFPGEWGYLSNVRIFPVIPDGGTEPEPCGFIGRTKEDCPRESNLLTFSFKQSRLSRGLPSPSSPSAPDDDDTADDEAALVLWELSDHSHTATAHHHPLTSTTLSHPSPLRAETIYATTPSPSVPPTPFAVKTPSGLSFTMSFTGRNEDFEGTRLMLYHLRIQAFLPSPVDKREMQLQWESCLQDTEGGGERGVYSASRNVTYLNLAGMEVVGDERAVVFLELRRGGMDLVVVVWDEAFVGAEEEEEDGGKEGEEEEAVV